MNFDFSSKDKPEYGLIILGNHGVGKSLICNMIIGNQRFKTHGQQEARSTKAEYHRIDTGSSDFLVHNIPGLIEAKQMEMDKNKTEIIKVFERSPQSIVIFVWTQLNGQPHPDDIIAFKALNQAFKFPSKSLIFILNNIPKERPSTYDGKFFASLTTMLNPISVSLEEMFFLDTLNISDYENLSKTRYRLLNFIANHREGQQKQQADLVLQLKELAMLRAKINEHYRMIQANNDFLQYHTKQITEAFEGIKKRREIEGQCVLPKTEELKPQEADKKNGIRGHFQQIRKQLADEKGLRKKVKKGCEIARSEFYNKCQKNEDENFSDDCDEKEGSRSIRRGILVGGLSAGAGGVIGAGAGGVIGAGAGGAVAGITIGGISGAIAYLRDCHKK